MDTIRAQNANAVFIAIASNTRERIENGERLREEMRQCLERGERPGGYRAAWLNDMADRLADVLGEAALEFNEAHDDDMCTAQDLGDIVATLMHRMENDG